MFGKKKMEKFRWDVEGRTSSRSDNYSWSKTDKTSDLGNLSLLRVTPRFSMIPIEVWFVGDPQGLAYNKGQGATKTSSG